MSNYIKTYQLDVSDVSIHEIAEATPLMTEANYNALKMSIHENGQQVPIIMYKGKCIDGRHRVKALIDLGISKVTAINESGTLSLEDIKNKVINVYEQRRHQTTTQKTIMALNIYNESLLKGQKISKGSVAESMGVSRNNLNRAEQLLKLAGSEIIEILFNGNKINIGTPSRPSMTDSLDTLVNFFKKHVGNIIEDSITHQPMNSDLTDTEISLAKDMFAMLDAQCSNRVLKYVSTLIYNELKESDT